MVKKIKSQGLNATTLVSPLTSTMRIEDVGSVGYRQFYYRTKREYQPDHTLTPLVLRPVVEAWDPDSKQAFRPQLTSVVWRVVDAAGNVAEYTASNPGADYSVGTDGTLTMRKNVSYGNGLTLTCILQFRDPRTGGNSEKRETVTVTTDEVAESVYTLTIGGLFNGNKTGDRVFWNPLSSQSPTVAFTAAVKQGTDDVTDAVKLFWYYRHNGAEVLVDDANDPCLAYVSGQHTKALTVDADHEDEVVEYIARIAADWTDAAGTAHKASEATQPNVEGVWARATVRWDIRRLKARVYSDNGDTTRPELTHHVYRPLFRQNGVDISEEKARERIVNEWKLGRVGGNGTAEEYLGTGPDVTVKEEKLTDQSGMPVTVTADSTVLGPLKTVSHGGAIVTQVVNGVKHIVVGRGME